MPLEPYPARFARHLPHAGKALSVVILFLHVSCIRFDDARKAASSYRSLPHWGRGTALAVDRVLSYNGALETISLALFHTAFPIQPPPLRGTSFHRKEGVSTRAPSLGRGCRAQRGGVGFLLGRRSRLLFAFPLGKGVVSRKAVSSYRSLPHWGRGTASAVDRVLSQTAYLRQSFPLVFHTASPSNLRPFGAPPSIERRE